MISGLVMTLSMGSLALFLNFASSIPDSWRWLPLVSIIGSFIGFSVGYATIPFCIMGEMLPVRLVPSLSSSSSVSLCSYSGQEVCLVLSPPHSTWPACSWCSSSTPPWQRWWGTLVCTGKIVLLLQNLITSHFRLFAGVNLCGIIFVFWALPETKGKSLEEIEEMFNGK